MKYILTEDVVFRAGTELEVSTDPMVPDGALEVRRDRGCMILFIGRASALDQGMVKAKPALRVV